MGKIVPRPFPQRLPGMTDDEYNTLVVSEIQKLESIIVSNRKKLFIVMICGFFLLIHILILMAFIPLN